VVPKFLDVLDFQKQQSVVDPVFYKCILQVKSQVARFEKGHLRGNNYLLKTKITIEISGTLEILASDKRP